MKYLDRIYIRNKRLSAVRQAAGRPCVWANAGRILWVLFVAGLLWALGNAGRCLDGMKQLVQIETVKEQLPADEMFHGYGGSFTDANKASVKEGIHIRLDEKVVSIFRVKESVEQRSD